MLSFKMVSDSLNMCPGSFSLVGERLAGAGLILFKLRGFTINTSSLHKENEYTDIDIFIFFLIMLFYDRQMQASQQFKLRLQYNWHGFTCVSSSIILHSPNPYLEVCSLLAAIIVMRLSWVCSVTDWPFTYNIWSPSSSGGLHNIAWRDTHRLRKFDTHAYYKSTYTYHSTRM